MFSCKNRLCRKLQHVELLFVPSLYTFTVPLHNRHPGSRSEVLGEEASESLLGAQRLPHSAWAGR